MLNCVENACNNHKSEITSPAELAQKDLLDGNYCGHQKKPNNFN